MPFIPLMYPLYTSSIFFQNDFWPSVLLTIWISTKFAIQWCITCLFSKTSIFRHFLWINGPCPYMGIRKNIEILHYYHFLSPHSSLVLLVSIWNVKQTKSIAIQMIKWNLSDFGGVLPRFWPILTPRIRNIGPIHEKILFLSFLVVVFPIRIKFLFE